MDDEVKITRWSVGSNMPGYMPDSSPEHFSNWQDARAYYIEDVARAIDEATKPDGSSASHCYSIQSAALVRLAKVRKTTEAQTSVEGYVHWLVRI